MKESSTCPKCKSRRQWIIEKFRAPSDTPAGSPMAVVLEQPSGQKSLFRATQSVGAFDLYVCADCGFAELWARDLEALIARPQEGVHLRDNTDPAQGPFR
jgi:hypothetical protein